MGYQMTKDRRYLYCDFDICDRQLKEFCFLCTENGKRYCDDICAERDLEQSRKREVFLWH